MEDYELDEGREASDAVTIEDLVNTATIKLSEADFKFCRSSLAKVLTSCLSRACSSLTCSCRFTVSPSGFSIARRCNKSFTNSA